MRGLPLYSRTRKKRAYPEAQLQKSAVQHLMLTGVPGLIYFSVPNEGRRSERLGHELKMMGLRPGVADLCLIIAGRAHFLELKSRDGKQSPEQVAFEADCRDAGVPYFVAQGINEVMAAFAAWGAVKVARRAA